MTANEKVLFTSPGNWVQVIETPRGFYYIRRKNKNSVAVFLLRKVEDEWEVLVRYQPLPVHNADLDSKQLLYPCPVTGGLDSLDERPYNCAVREAEEETGYATHLNYLGDYIAGTQTDETVYMYWADVTDVEPSEALQDGTYFESISKNKWKHISCLQTYDYVACQLGYYLLKEVLD